MKARYFIILLFCSINVFSQRFQEYELKEALSKNVSNKFDSILIIGVGFVATRIFLDDLSKQLINGLAKDITIANYQYLGKTVKEAEKYFDTINRVGYKAVLFFLPEGESYFNAQRNSDNTQLYSPVGPVNTIFTVDDISYEQDFNFELCLPKEQMRKVWIASVSVSSDPGKSKIAKKLSGTILSLFKKKKYI